MEDLEPADGPVPNDAEIPHAGDDPQDPGRPEIDEDDTSAPIGAPQQDLDVIEEKEEINDLSDQDEPNNNAAADNANPDDSDAESELSEIDEAQFEDFDPSNIAIEERPVAVDESNVNLLKASKRKRTEGEEEGTKKQRKEGRRERPKKSRRPADDDDNFSGGEEIEGKRRRKTKAIEGERKERPRPRKATPENEEHLTPEERRKRALDRAMDEALKKPGQRRKRAGDITVEAQNDELIEQMRIRMTDAAKADTEARTHGKPAMAKLKLLPEVTALLNRNKLKEQLVDPDTNLLEAVRFFLEPLNDGSLPAYNIQHSLFTVLSRLPISKDSLVASGIGKVTWFYTKSTKPEPHVKRLAEQLLRDWTRPILKRTDDYRKRELLEANFDPRALPTREAAAPGSTQQVLSQAARERKLAAPTKQNRARLEGGHASYTVVPRSNVSAVGGLGQRSGGADAFRKFKARHQQRVGAAKR